MTALFLANKLGHGRLGIIASRRLGGAVARNRAKRLIREVFRRNKTIGSGWDLAIIPKTDLLDADFTAIEADFRAICQRHTRRTRP
jgi:ribonuclease P protein component